MCVLIKKKKKKEPAITLCFPNQEANVSIHMEEITCRPGRETPGNIHLSPMCQALH